MSLYETFSDNIIYKYIIQENPKGREDKTEGKEVDGRNNNEKDETRKSKKTGFREFRRFIF